MPFLHSKDPQWIRRWTKTNVADRNGFRIAAYGAHTKKEKYTGDFKDDLRHGEGVQHYKDGATYEGEFASGQRHGQGVYKGSGREGSRKLINGLWHEGIPHGYGHRFYINGRIYEGDFHKGKRHGTGCMLYPDGSIYIGYWVAGQREGVGRLISPNSTKNYYDGEWRNDKKCGRGIFYHGETGQIQEGVWLDDVPQASKLYDDKELRNYAPKRSEWFIPRLGLKYGEEVYIDAANRVKPCQAKWRKCKKEEEISKCPKTPFRITQDSKCFCSYK